MIGEFTEKAKTYEDIAKANGVELTKEVRDTITDLIVFEEQQRQKEIEVTEKESNKYKYIRSQKELQRHFDENGYGDFYFNFYNNINSIMEPQFITRCMYLFSYTDYKNRLVFKNSSRKYEPMTNDDIMEVLRLKNSEYYKTKKVLVDNDILLFDDGVYYINDKYCKRGVIMNNKKDDKIRNFDIAIKELYENSTPKEHKYLSLIYKILPYINYKHNVVCKNPDEENRNMIQAYSVKELSEIMGYANQTIFKNKLLSLTVNNKPVVVITLVAKKSAIMINPRVYYKGNEKSDVKNIENDIDMIVNSIED